MPSQKRLRAKARAAAATKPKSQSTMTAQQLFDHAQQALMFDRYNEAKDFFRKALKLEPHNIEFLDTFGAVLAEVGPPDEAMQVLQTAVQVSPDAGFEKYMYLGQLCDGEEAVQHVRKGIAVLEHGLQRLQEGSEGGEEGMVSEQVSELSQQLCSALCALAELLLEQASEVAQVAGDVSAALNRALTVCPSSPEPLQALASLRYEEGRPEEALHLLKQSMDKWFKPRKEEQQQEEEQQQQAAAEEPVLQKPKAAEEASDEEMAGGSGDGMDEGSDDDEELPDELPSYEFRFECAKLLLELDETTDAAIQVLEDLLQEDDTVLDVWHLLGLSYYSGHEYDDAAEIVQHGMKLMEKQGVRAEEEIASSFAELHAAIEEARSLQQQEQK